MSNTVILTGTDPSSRLGGIGFALPGYLRALDNANIHWSSIPTYHPALPGGKWRVWLTAFPRLIREISAARKRSETVMVYSHAGAGLSLLREFFILLLSRALGAATIMQLHAPELDDYLAHPVKRKLLRLAILPAWALAVLTPWWERRLRAGGIRKPLFVVPNPLPTEWEALARSPRMVKESSGKIVLLSLSRLVRGKGVEAVIEAMPYLPAEFELVVAGDGCLREELIQRVNALGLQQRVHFMGWVSGEKKQRLLDMADMFVLPSRYDSFGMGFLEAMANGLPVVAAEWGAIPDVVAHGRCGILVREETPQALATAILSLRDLGLRNRMGQEAKLWVLEKFSAEIVGRQIAAMLQMAAK